MRGNQNLMRSKLIYGMEQFDICEEYKRFENISKAKFIYCSIIKFIINGVFLESQPKGS